jgi:ABC-type bacteriocin/lantibiotic exporter with double-glycine peptidase domain
MTRLQQPPAGVRPENANAGTLGRIRDLRFRWRRDGPQVLALDALDIGRGERLFIEGPSGSGKSTPCSVCSPAGRCCG